MEQKNGNVTKTTKLAKRMFFELIEKKMEKFDKKNDKHNKMIDEIVKNVDHAVENNWSEAKLKAYICSVIEGKEFNDKNKPSVAKEVHHPDDSKIKNDSEIVVKQNLEGSRSWSSIAKKQILIIDKEEGSVKQLEDQCKYLNINYSVHKTRSATSCINHQVDGQVNRPVARRWMMSALYGITEEVMVKSGRNGKKQRWLDAYGAMRNESFINSINEQSKVGRVDLQVHRAECVVKDLLRNTFFSDDRGICHAPGPDTFSKVLVGNEALQWANTKHFDAMILEDVQHHGVSDKATVLGLVSKGIVVGMVCHIQKGEMGTQGSQGVWFRDGDVIHSWAHSGDQPYTDTEDMTWLLEKNCCYWGSSWVSWYIERVYGNIYYAIIAPIKTTKPSEGHCYVEVEKATINFSVTIERTCGIFNCTGFSDWRTVAVHAGIASQVAQMYLARSLQGMSDRAVLDRVATLLNASSLKRLQEYRRNEWHALIAHTAVLARNIILGIQVVFYEGARARAREGSQIAEDAANVNSVTDRLRAHWCGWNTVAAMGGCCVVLPVMAGAMFAGYRVVSSMIPVSIDIPLLPVDDLFIQGVEIPGQEMGFDAIVEGRNAWVNYGVIKVKRRRMTQTPRVAGLRGGLTPDDVVYINGKDKVLFDKQVFSETKLEFTNTFAIGPAPLPFHFNAKSAGGMMGIVHSIIKPMYNHVTPEEQARNWMKFEVIPMVSRQMSRLAQGFNVCTMEERVQWAEEQEKRKLYLDALKEIDKNPPKDVEYSSIDAQSKTNDGLAKSKERVICGLNAKVTVSVGPEVAMITKFLKEVWAMNQAWRKCGDIRFRSHYGAGKTSEELGMIALEFTQLEEGQYSGVYAGDDDACAICIYGVRYYIEGDASDWDHSQSEAMIDGQRHGPLYSSYNDLLLLGMPKETADNIRKGQCGKVRAVNPEKPSEMVVIDLKNSPRRQSGETTTACANTLNTARLYTGLAAEAYKLITEQFSHDADPKEISAALRNHFVAEAAKCGIKLKLQVFDHVGRLTFLKGFFVPCLITGGLNNSPSSGFLWFPSPEIISKMGQTETCAPSLIQYNCINRDNSDNHTQDRWQQFLSDVVYGKKQYRDMPLIEALLSGIQKVVNLDDSVRAKVHEKRYIEVTKVAVGTNHEWEHMLSRLEIQQAEWDDFVEKLRNHKWKPGHFLLHDVWTKLVQVYR